MSFFCINLIVYMGYVLIYLKRMYLKYKAINSIYIYISTQQRIGGKAFCNLVCYQLISK